VLENPIIRDGCHVILVILCLDMKTLKYYNIFNILNILQEILLYDCFNPMSEFTPPANIFKALMHPARLSILEILRGGEQCVCHLEAVLGCRQAYISQHLMVLREAGLVEDRREGTRIFYRVVKQEVFELVDAASQLSGMEGNQVNHSRVKDCPCPKCNPVAEGLAAQENEH
jgi:DNA-binding transcriptional ArsR family regulator